MSIFDRLLGRGSPDIRHTKGLLAKAGELSKASRFQAAESVHEFCIDVVVAACTVVDETPCPALTKTLVDFLKECLSREAFLFSPRQDIDPSHLSLTDGVALREHLENVCRILGDESRYVAIWERTAVSLVTAILKACPVEAYSDAGEAVQDVSVLQPSVPLYEVIDDLPHVLDAVLGTLVWGDAFDSGLFAVSNFWTRSPPK